MKYINANNALPKQLLVEIQKYVQGQLIYIPNTEGTRKKWGENSGSREYIKYRNEKICEEFTTGLTIDQLSEKYCLSVYSIQKIVYSKKRR
ncbi:CD3324 family protein [Bacillus spongiae]|uniref:CD3324 family protein n=1 Tax=Bacillus spongiae TaxID=2683610 RepID=A0ABU8H9K2_9BACI